MTDSLTLQRTLLLALAVVAVAVAVATAAWARTGVSARRNGLLQHVPLRVDDSVSINWAGYVVGGASFSAVTASWIEPHVSCTGTHPLDASSFWIGLGGASFSSPGLEQIGTSADCVKGSPHYYAWAEVLPAPATDVAVTVEPGDVIAAEVHQDGTMTTFVLRNITTGDSFQREFPVRFPAVDSAEWIAESPSICTGANACEPLPLARFRSVLFTSATATANGHTGSIRDPAWQLEAVRLSSVNGPVSARPSLLSADGSSFSVATHGPRVKLPYTSPLARELHASD